jgi:amidase
MLSELEAGRISADELLSTHLARNALLHERLNAVVAVDAESARKAARAVDEARRRKEPVGPLAGLPMTIKDGLDVHNMPAVVGNPEFVNRSKNCSDATVVARARSAGAVIWGKSNVPLMLGDIQTCNAVYGTTNNPYDPARVPGGSSGGSAAALAAGITPLEIGSDIGGSLRHPANYCGVFSLKPTWGALPQQGHIPPHPDRWFDVDLNVVGPMARSAEDLRLLYGVLCDRAPAPRRDARHVRIALWDEEPGFPLANDVRKAVRASAEALSRQGMRVEIAKPRIDGDELMAAYVALVNAVMSPNLPDAAIHAYAEQRAADSSAIEGRGAWASLAYHRYFSTASYREIMKSLVVREAMRRILAEFFADWDAILMPITPILPFPHVLETQKIFHERMFDVDATAEPSMKLITWIALATFLQAPAIAVPAGQVKGLPVGIQFVGPWHKEDRLFEIAATAEEILGGFRPPAI